MAEESMASVIKAVLDQFNIGDQGLVDDVVKAVADGRLDENSQSFINDIGIVLSDNTYIQERFKGNVQRKKAGLQPLPLSDVLRMENGYITALQSANMPAGFYDDPATDFQNFIARDISPDEINRRIVQGYAAVRDADPEVVKQFKELGIYEGDLAAYFLDPARQESKIAAQIEQAQIGAAARKTAGVQLTGAQAEELQQAGVSQTEAQKGFGSIAQQGELYGVTTAEQAAGEQNITLGEQIGAEFGTNAAAAQRVATRRRKRQAAFETGGRFAQANQYGVEGLRTIGQ